MVRGGQRSRNLARRPARAVVAGFGVAVLVGTALLALPWATESGDTTELVPALFTAVSAVCVTGLTVVDTPGYWSTVGELTILALIQVGGIGIMTLASLLGLIVARRIVLRLQLSAQAETKTVGLGDVRAVVRGVLVTSLVIEVLVAIPLALRFAVTYGEPPGRAIYLGVFHAVSAFNNAGFALFSDNLLRFTTDAVICVPIMIGVVLGGIGFPVLFEVGRRLRRGRHNWSLHVRITIVTYGLLLLAGVATFLVAEWRNAGTLGPLDLGGKLLAGTFHGVMPRTAGFNSLDVAAFRPETLLINGVLMFIGGGSAGTAGASRSPPSRCWRS